MSKIIGDKVYYNKINVADFSYPKDEDILKNTNEYFSNEMDELSVNKKDLSKNLIMGLPLKINNSMSNI